MPILKPISGHGSTGGIRRYLEKGGRALARDLFHLSYDERDAGALGEGAKEACAYQIQYTREQCDSALKKWVDNYGIEVYEMTAENANLFRQKIQPVYDKFSAYNELIDLLK